jgi:hypothetical protein
MEGDAPVLVTAMRTCSPSTCRSRLGRTMLRHRSTQANTWNHVWQGLAVAGIEYKNERGRISMMPRHAEPFIAARDLLLRLGSDYDAAVREFRWPMMDRFNWALDYFDHLPAADLALWCIFETEEKLSFGALRARSNQVANHLRELGVRRGDRVMLLVPNVRQLWEALLALMKLGAVISPATILLTETDIKDRFERGRMRHAIVDASLTGRFANLRGNFTRIAVGGVPGWHRFEDAYAASETFVPDGETRDRSLGHVFYLRHNGKAQARSAQPSELPDRTTERDVLLRPAAG